jgi:ABC-type iron transport system FetAB permease component
MNDIQYRFLLFTFCIIVRLLFVFLAKFINPIYLPYLGMLAILPSFGFIFIYLFDLRKSGREVLNNKIWWNNLRPVHGCLYLLFSLLAIKKHNNAWVALLIDVLIGVIAFTNYHYQIGNFKILFNKL